MDTVYWTKLSISLNVRLFNYCLDWVPILILIWRVVEIQFLTNWSNCISIINKSSISWLWCCWSIKPISIKWMDWERVCLRQLKMLDWIFRTVWVFTIYCNGSNLWRICRTNLISYRLWLWTSKQKFKIQCLKYSRFNRIFVLRKLISVSWTIRKILRMTYLPSKNNRLRINRHIHRRIFPKIRNKNKRSYSSPSSLISKYFQTKFCSFMLSVRRSIRRLGNWWNPFWNVYKKWHQNMDWLFKW